MYAMHGIHIHSLSPPYASASSRRGDRLVRGFVEKNVGIRMRTVAYDYTKFWQYLGKVNKNLYFYSVNQ